MNLVDFHELPGMLAAILLSFFQSEPVVPEGAGPTAKVGAEASFAALMKALPEDGRFWTAPFVLADRETRTVFVWGESTGMIPGDPLEFFVISEQSGHGYEALMIAFAAPSDIHAALEAVGLQAGGPVDPDVHRFWPRGDRVDAFFLYSSPEDGEALLTRPAEAFCIWKREPMPPLPWVFTGAPRLPSLTREGKEVYAPDDYSPNSIAATFNLRATVFDLPLQGSKTAVYGDFLLDPDWKLPEGRPMLLKLRPAAPGRFPPEIDITLRIGPEAVLAEGVEGLSPGDLADVGAFLSDRRNEVHFLTLDFADALTVTEATRRAREVQLLEQHVESIRIEPPPAGQMFFQSFVPDPRFQDREKRPSQPVELHLNENGSAVAMDLKEDWGESRSPTLLETRVPLNTPEDWLRFMEDRENRSSVLFLFVPPELTLRELRRWTQPVLAQFPIVFVYRHGE